MHPNDDRIVEKVFLTQLRPNPTQHPQTLVFTKTSEKRFVTQHLSTWVLDVAQRDVKFLLIRDAKCHVVSRRIKISNEFFTPIDHPYPRRFSDF